VSEPARELFRESRRWVVKIGSALLTADGRGIDQQVVDAIVAQLMELRARGCDTVLVSSGAVAAGLSRLGWSERPGELPALQAAAAVGQSALLQHYEQALAARGVLGAQVLLGHDDIEARDRYLNARATLSTLLEHRVIPVVNENDTVVTDEIRFGDNDTLAALVANLIDADVLVLLTDQDGLFSADPRRDPDARLVPHAAVTDTRLDNMVGEGGRLGRGGMVTKLRAARLAARSGTETVIAGGRTLNVLPRLAAGEALGTWLESGREPQRARHQWLASLVTAKGILELDDGAVTVLRSAGRSLLPVGVRAVSGRFRRGDVVLCRDAEGREVARGLCNYSADEARTIIGHASSRIPELLGYGGEAELIHRDNLVLL
jgi:glutamate 5-kinase